MPIIPDYEAYRGGEHRPSVASPRSAGLVAEANAKLGQQVSSAVTDLGGLAMRERRAKDLGEESRIAAGMAERAELHRQYRESNPDETSWGGDLDSHVSMMGEQVANMKASPEARARADAGFQQWAGGLRADTVSQARAHAVNRSRNDSARHREGMERRGDFEGSRAQLGREVEAGLKSPEEAEEERLQIGVREQQWLGEQAEKREYERIAADPSSWLAAQVPGKVLPGVNPLNYRLRQEFAAKTMEKLTAETASVIRDGIAAGKVTTPEQVRDLASQLRPGAVNLLVNELQLHAEGKLAEQRKSPHFVAEVVGKATDLMSKYRLDFDHYDDGYVAIQLEIGRLNEGPEKTHLNEQLVKLREGKLREVQTAQDLAERTLVDLYEDGVFGKVDGTGRGRGVTRTAIDSSLLRDPVKLEKRGFAPEQAKEIAEAYNPVPVFRRLHAGITAKDANAPYDSAALDAVRDRKEEFEWTDPDEEAKAEAERLKARVALGKARIKVMEFARLNPQAKEEEFEAAIRKIEKGEKLGTQSEHLVGEAPEILRKSYFDPAVDSLPERRRQTPEVPRHESAEDAGLPRELRRGEEDRSGTMQ
jgi:hypothetical protein